MPADSRSAAAICSTVNLGMPDIFFSIQTSNDERSGRELLINVQSADGSNQRWAAIARSGDRKLPGVDSEG